MDKDVEEARKKSKRLALLVAEPPTTKRKSNSCDVDICPICQTSTITPNNGMQLPTQETWNKLAQKSAEWRVLDSSFNTLYERIKVDDTPRKIHKICKIDVTGVKLTRAQNAHTLNVHSTAQSSDTGDDEVDSRVRISSRSCFKPDTCCVICSDPLDGKTKRNSFGEKVPVLFNRIETDTAWKTFVDAIPYVEDETRRNRLEALSTFCNSDGGILKAAALDIRYHRDCWKSYCRPVYNVRHEISAGEERKQRKEWVTEKQNVAFRQLCDYLVDSLQVNKEVYTLRDILSEYEQLQRDMMITNEEIRNTCDDRHALRSLKQKLIDRFGNDIGFQSRYRRNESSIVFYPQHGGAYVESAVNSWGIANSDLIRNLATNIHCTYRTEPGMPWPCSLNDLKVDNTPNDIHNLVALLADPHSKYKDGRAAVVEKLQPCVRFLSEGLMHLITKERQPLQVSISMSVHNMTGSKELIQMLKGLRLGISYNDVLDELAALAYQERNKSNDNSTLSADMQFLTGNVHFCPNEIRSGLPCTVVMDNDDFNEDSLTGSETSHYTNVIMAQPTRFRMPWNPLDNQHLVIPTSKDRKKLVLPLITKQGQSCGIRQKPNPRQLHIYSQTDVPCRITAHAILRELKPGDGVPAFTGYHCSLESTVDKWETFNVKSYAQPPSKEVVVDVMNWCQNIAEQKNMPLIQLAADQAVYKFIEEVLCEDESKYSRVKGVLGGFHTEMSYLNALGKRYEGSGLEELAVASGIVAAGSAHRALCGKHYNRGMRIHKLVSEALLHMLIQRFIEKNPDKLFDIQSIADITTEDDHEQYIRSSAFNEFVHDMFEEQQNSGSEMARYWLSYIIDVEVLFQHYHCLRSGNSFIEYLESCRRMLPLLAAYGNINYLRYLSVYYWRMSTLSKNEMENMADIYSLSLTGKNYSRLPPDQVIEMTMNKQSKNRRSGGWVGFSRNLTMVAISILSRPVILQLREQLQESIHFKKSVYHHPELGPSRIKKDMSVMGAVKTALHEWDADPWDETNVCLRSLSSGQPATEEVLKSLSTAHEDGSIMVDDMLARLTSGAKSIHDKITKRKSKSFATKTTLVKSKKDCRASFDHSGMKRVIDLVTSGDRPSQTLENILQYRITSVSLSLFTADEIFHKPIKSKFITLLNLQPLQAPSNYHAVIDVGMAWNKVPPSKLWSEYAHNLFKYIVCRHPQAVAFHFINDIYEEDLLKTSPKQHEQQRRSKSYGFVANIYPVADQKMPVGPSWRSFLSKQSNKQRLQQFLIKEWRSYAHNADMYFTMNLECYNVKTGAKESRFQADSSCEADTRAFFKAAQLDNACSIVFDFEDTDVWIIASYITHLTEQPMYMYKKKAGDLPVYHSCRSFFKDHDVAAAALAVYAFTGVDTVGGFFGCGKVTSMKRLLLSKDLTYMTTMMKVGIENALDNDLIEQLEHFTIRIIYNDPVSERLCDARARKWRQMSYYDSARLPPDKDSFVQHCLRTHLQVYEWKHSRRLQALLPSNFGWTLQQDILKPTTHTVPALPVHMATSVSSDVAQIAHVDDKTESELSDTDDDTDNSFGESSQDELDTDEDFDD